MFQCGVRWTALSRERNIVLREIRFRPLSEGVDKYGEVSC